ncbi:MAG: RNA polymerase sigma factor RpoD, partial [Gammaproteobacteria bacterium]|nr:RNA polymerase sigma factor RpoD [Gammaproteobacteria bacterium]
MPMSKKPSVSAAKKTAETKPLKVAAMPATKASAVVSHATAATKVKKVPAKTSPVAEATKPAAKKVGRPPKATSAAPAAAAGGAKRGRKPKAGSEQPTTDVDLSDIEDDLTGEEPTTTAAVEEKVKPLRMKISKAKERALMKEFGLDETVLSEEDLAKRRSRLKTLITLGKTRGYLTHGEISDHLPDKLVDAETMEVVVTMLNDMGVAVYEQTPDAETLLLNNTAPTATTVEEAEEEAEAALSTVDSEFGRTTDPVRMYMREMGTVELLTREGEIEIAKRIEGGLMDMMEAISASPATIAEILRLGPRRRLAHLGEVDAEMVDDHLADRRVGP